MYKMSLGTTYKTQNKTQVARVVNPIILKRQQQELVFYQLSSNAEKRWCISSTIRHLWRSQILKMNKQIIKIKFCNKAGNV